MFTWFNSASLILCQLARGIRAHSILGDAQHIRHIGQDIKLCVGLGGGGVRVKGLNDLNAKPCTNKNKCKKKITQKMIVIKLCKNKIMGGMYLCKT